MSAPTNTLAVTSKSVESVYREYLTGMYVVNRRYQRKLVWTMEEKERLIDSITHLYPLPQFLVAEESSRDGISYEIIDGMQRLNAIISFLENEFSCGGLYFDLESLADTKKLMDEGVLIQRKPIMSRDESVRVSGYQIAQSVYRTLDPSSVEDVFRRINSSGQKLSKHDLRQAGTLSPFADMVREIACRIRGDESPGVLVPLAAMKKISISWNSAGYGISPEDIFWVKQGILNRPDVRSSGDEQLILDILGDICVKPMPKTGAPTRDGLYGFGEHVVSDAAVTNVRNDPAWIHPSKQDEVIGNFFAAFDRVEGICDKLPQRLVKHIGLSGNNPMARYFEALFVAVYRLVVERSLELTDVALVISQLQDLTQVVSISGGGGEWAAHEKETVIGKITEKIEHAFKTARQDDVVGTPKLLSSEIRTILSSALIENSSLELKQGFIPLGESRISNQIVQKICKTLSALTNEGVVSGSLIVGIADDANAAAKLASARGLEPVVFRGYDVLGIGNEPGLMGSSLGSYWDSITRSIGDMNALPKDYRSEIIRQSGLVDFEGRVLALFRAPSTQTPIEFDGKFYVRRGSEVVEVSPEDTTKFVMAFTKRLLGSSHE